MNVRKIENQVYLPILKEMIMQGKDVRLTVSGNSMAPFLIHERDSVLLTKAVYPLKKGEIVFYQRDNKQYILHRIIKKDKDGYYITGDHQNILEYVKEKQIFAVVNKVYRKGKWLKEYDFWNLFFKYIWIRMIPIRNIVQKVYQKIKF